jgi:hypothetical protein
MKLTQNPCRIKLPNTKSANALSELTLPLPSSMISPVTPSTVLVVAFFAAAIPAGARSLVCMRSEAVRTNWPTAAEKPERKALKG